MSWLNKWWPKLGSAPGKRKLSLQSQAKHVDLNLPPPSMEPISNFTPRAEQSLELARREARQLKHNYVGSEHLLLGLIALGQGVAANALITRGMTLDAVRGEVGKQAGPSPSRKTARNIPCTSELEKILARAAEQAQALRHTYIGVEHILLGLIAEPGDVVSRVFKRFAVEPRFVRLDVLRELDPNHPSVTATPATKAAPSPTAAKATQPANAPKTVTLPQPAPTPQPAKLAKPPQPVSTPQPGKTPAPSKPPPPSQVTTSPTPNGSVDIMKRYDIYCTDASQGVAVHRNARFKSLKHLLPGSQNDPLAAFFELELENGQAIFVPRSSIIRFESPTPGAGT